MANDRWLLCVHRPAEVVFAVGLTQEDRDDWKISSWTALADAIELKAPLPSMTCLPSCPLRIPEMLLPFDLCKVPLKRSTDRIHELRPMIGCWTL